MTMHINVSGTWKEITAPGVKDSGVWKDISGGWVKVSGVWKKFFEVGGGGGDAITLSGTLSASGTTTTIDGPAPTVTIPPGNVSNQIEFRNADTSLGAIWYNNNGAGFVGFSGSTSPITLVNGGTLQMRGSGLAVGEFVTADLYDVDTNTLIQSILITR